MKDENKVSIWIGNFDNETELEDYIEKPYNEDEDSFLRSRFMKDFSMEYYDEDFQDAYIDRESTDFKSLMESASYSETFIEQVSEIYNNENTVIAIYDFAYNGTVKRKNRLFFLGVFNYSKD